jgi:hypothetical protein
LARERVARLDFNRVRDACQYADFQEISGRRSKNVFAVAALYR